MSQSSSDPGSAGSLDSLIRRLVSTADQEIATLLEGADEWAISPETANLLSGLIKFLAPASVLEFGAGRSTLVIAHALQSIGGGRITSVEHQPAFAETAWRRMSNYTKVDALLVGAKLKARLSPFGVLHEYVGIGPRLALRAPFDFVFIDGPPGHLGRDATLLRAAPFLSPGATVLLDDAARPMEQTAVRRWERTLDVARVFDAADIGRGVTIMRARSDRRRFSLRVFLGTVHDRLLEVSRST